MSILRTNQKYQTYKPLKYEWAYLGYELLDAQRWHAKEVPVGGDVKDYYELPESERKMVRNILRLFTQNDVEALNGYSVLLPLVKPTEIKMYLSTATFTEVIHVDFYSNLTDTLGFSDEFYQEFLEIPVMERKIDYLEKAKVKRYEDYKAMGLTDAEVDIRFRQDVIKMVGVYAAGLEGIELMAQFAMLLAWTKLGKFQGMGQGNTYSVLDENIHQIFNTKLFLTLAEENSDVYTDEIRSDIRNAIIQISEQEMAMTDYLYDNGSHPVITREQAKEFVKFMTDRALTMMELAPVYDISKNPIPFMDELLANVEFANFFEVDVTAYSENILSGDWRGVQTDKVDFLKMKKGGQ